MKGMSKALKSLNNGLAGLYKGPKGFDKALKDLIAITKVLKGLGLGDVAICVAKFP